MSRHRCGLCGKDSAEDFASVNDIYYCHEGESPTCYEIAQAGPGRPADEVIAELRALFGDPEPKRVIHSDGQPWPRRA